MQSLGLQVEYQQDGELRSFVMKVAALAFVPLRLVRLAWMGVKASQPSLPGVHEFVEYFQNTWMSGRYSPATWNVHEVDECQTNNHIEG